MRGLKQLDYLDGSFCLWDLLEGRELSRGNFGEGDIRFAGLLKVITNVLIWMLYWACGVSD